MQRRVIGEKEVLFKADDPAHALFYLLEGTLHLPEIDKELGPGSIIGEFALFSDTGRRTATAVAKTDCIVMALTKSAVFSALVQHPPARQSSAQDGDRAHARECKQAEPDPSAGKDRRCGGGDGWARPARNGSVIFS
jgi:hypothetical protein